MSEKNETIVDNAPNEINLGQAAEDERKQKIYESFCGEVKAICEFHGVNALFALEIGGDIATRYFGEEKVITQLGLAKAIEQKFIQ